MQPALAADALAAVTGLVLAMPVALPATTGAFVVVLLLSPIRRQPVQESDDAPHR